MKHKNLSVKRGLLFAFFALCIVIASSNNVTAKDNQKAKKTATGYSVSKLKIPYEYRIEEYGVASIVKNAYAKDKKKLVLQTSACYFGGDDDVYKTYKTTWDSEGSSNIADGMQVPGDSFIVRRFKKDDNGNSYFVEKDPDKDIPLYICNSSGELVDTWKLNKKLKSFFKTKNKLYSVIDYEIRNNRISLLITEDHLKSGKITSSVQVFNVKNGKRIKVYKLPYQFNRIDNGYLYGITSQYEKDMYGYKYPVKEGFYKCSIDGKKCLWNYNCDDSKIADYDYDITNEKIVYLDDTGLYQVDTRNQKKPKLIVDNKECKVLKTYYEGSNSIDQIYAINSKLIYIPYNRFSGDHGNDEIYMLKIKL